MAMKTTPSIELLLDRSGSMAMNDISPTRYKALHTALTSATGAITQTQADVYFGAALFSGDFNPCPPNAQLDQSATQNTSVARALNNANAIDALIASNTPSGSTPTADWVTAVTADFGANPPPMGSPPLILLATDGEPNACGNGNDNGAAVAAAQAAYAAGVRLFIIGLQLNDQTAIQFLQDMANAGTGMPTGQAPMCAGCAPYYTANNPTDLVNGVNAIISGVLSCDLTLSGQVDPTQASQGTVTLNGMMLTYGTDWTVTGGGTTLELLGSACSMLEASTNPQVDASFPCGDVIIQ
ncbi:MAG TPA: vWA domain-containing protein [Kofleriaceae bacterium]